MLGLVVGVGLLCSGARTVVAEDAKSIVQKAVEAELAADRDDHSRWRYRDEEQTKRTVSIVVETDAGSVKRLVERDGRPLSDAEAKAEDARLAAYIHDASRLAKAKRDSAADDKSATELLRMLPDAFLWKVMGEDAGSVTLGFVPNPGFRPPDMQSRVLGAMSGEMVVDRASHHIRTLSGTLTTDVMLGYGLLGRMKQGGTFRVERREVGPGEWQITETHVHIDGKALMFKSIGEQQDELQTEFRPVGAGTTMEQALAMSRER